MNSVADLESGSTDAAYLISERDYDIAKRRSRGPYNRPSYRVDAEIPESAKQAKVVWMILSDPPPMPKCWSRPNEWREWLILAHASGMKLTRRVDLGKHRGERVVKDVFANQLDHCQDCTTERQAAMRKEGRCSPYVADPKRRALIERLAVESDLVFDVDGRLEVNWGEGRDVRPEVERLVDSVVQACIDALPAGPQTEPVRSRIAGRFGIAECSGVDLDDQFP